ncbi:TonB-dependent receptor domain-containing protein [Klebsiella grimontii]
MKRWLILLAAFPLLASAAAERIVSLGGDVTEVIYALDAQRQLVAKDSTSTWPAAAQSLPDVGYIRQLNAEGILSLRPTLVLASAQAQPSLVLKKVEENKVKVINVPGGYDLPAIEAKIAVIADALGKQSEGNALRQKVHQQTDSVTRAMQTVSSDYDTDTWGIQSALAKSIGRHDLSAGFNASTTKTQRPLTQSPTPSAFSQIMQPDADSRGYIVAGFLQDKINFDLDEHNFAVIPGIRVMHQSTRPENVSDLANNSSVLTGSDVSNLYGKNADTQALPSLVLQYDITPRLMTYLQYQRGAQFPNASQLYGSWNLGSSYAGRAQYALIGNTDLKTETSDNVEWGMKGEVAEGITMRTALFYNTYKNFIAYTRYTRANNPVQFTNVPSNIYTIYQAENRDKAYIYGGEISAKFNFGTWFEEVNGLSATLAYGYSEGQSKSSYSGDKYVDLDSVAPMKAIVGVAWDDPAKVYGTALTATFVKGKRATATSRESYTNTGSAITDSTSEYMRVPGYGMLDWTAYWQVAKNVRVNGGVYNITDRKYWDYLSSRNIEMSTNQDANDRALAVMPGRTWQLGVNVDF